MRTIITTRRLSAFACSLFAALTLACGGGDGGDSSTGPSNPPPPAPGSGDATLTLANHSSNGTVMFFRRKACGSIQWGSDMLGVSLLSGGEQQSWTLTAGCYDFRATPAEVGIDYVYFLGVQLDAGESETLTIDSFPADQ